MKILASHESAQCINSMFEGHMLANARYTTRPPLSPHLQPGADAPVVSTHAPVGVRGEALANERGEVLLSSIVPEAPG